MRYTTSYSAKKILIFEKLSALCADNFVKMTCCGDDDDNDDDDDAVVDDDDDDNDDDAIDIDIDIDISICQWCTVYVLYLVPYQPATLLSMPAGTGTATSSHSSKYCLNSGDSPPSMTRVTVTQSG